MKISKAQLKKLISEAVKKQLQEQQEGGEVSMDQILADLEYYMSAEEIVSVLPESPEGQAALRKIHAEYTR